MLKGRVIKAYQYAEEKHKGQFRKFSGFPYFVHPKGVAKKVEALTNDEDLVISALFHDLVEDCNVQVEYLRVQYGDRVADIVDELTTKPYDKTKFKKVDILLEKMVTMSSDGLTIKLMDRWDNVQWMDKDCKTKDQQQFVKRYYEETKVLMNELNRLRKDKTELQNVVIRRIQVELDLIKIKHLW